MALPYIPKSHPKYISHRKRGHEFVHGVSKAFPFMDNLVGAIEYEFPGFKDVVFGRDKQSSSHQSHQPFMRGSDMNSRVLGFMNSNILLSNKILNSVDRNTKTISPLLKLLIKHTDDVKAEVANVYNTLRWKNDGQVKAARESMRWVSERERNEEFSAMVKSTKFHKRVLGEKASSIFERASQPSDEQNKKNSGGLLDNLGRFGSIIRGLISSVLMATRVVGGMAAAGALIVTLYPALKKAYEALTTTDGSLWEKVKSGAVAGGSQFLDTSINLGEMILTPIQDVMKSMMKSSTLLRSVITVIGELTSVIFNPFIEMFKSWKSGGEWIDIIKSGAKSLVTELWDSVVAIMDMVAEAVWDSVGSIISLLSGKEDGAKPNTGKTLSEWVKSKWDVVATEWKNQKSMMNNVIPEQKELEQANRINRATIDNRDMKNTIQKASGTGNGAGVNVVNAPSTQNNKTNNIIANPSSRNPHISTILGTQIQQ